ncbi:YlbF family regulator [Eubacteriales bacterium OttesenSCG-928-K08]|nr:YlbF family regulator [Eubacteriales bacterium OttesenSCG-928-K08]
MSTEDIGKIDLATQALVEALTQSEAYRAYSANKQAVLENDVTRSLYSQYSRLLFAVQADTVAGRENEAQKKQLQQYYDMLIFDESAYEFIMAEHRLQDLMGKIYKQLANAVGVDIAHLEE